MSTKIKIEDEWKTVSGITVNRNLKPNWDNPTNVTSEQLVAGYTAPFDGQFVGYGRTTTDYTAITVNGIVVSTQRFDSGIQYANQVQVIVKKGDIIKSSGSYNNYTFKLVPWE